MNAPVFREGQRVRIADRTPPVHHRVPSYVKGQVGVIERVVRLNSRTPSRFSSSLILLLFRSRC